MEFLRGHGRGDLRFGEHVRGVKYALAPDGRIVLPVMVAMLQEVDTVLYVPDMSDDALEVAVTFEEFKESGSGGALADRWRIYHGDPPDVHWVIASPDAARFGGFVIDGEAITVANSLTEGEAGLCRWLNQDHADDLPALCRHGAGIGVAAPCCVSVDPGGINLRGQFDIYRVPFASEMATVDDARAALETLLADANRAAADSTVPEEAPIESVGENAGDAADRPPGILDDWLENDG